jgi:lambda family phage tail tape measure protein
MANQRYVLEFSLQDVGSSLKAGKKDADAFRGSLESIQKLSAKTGTKGGGGWKSAMMGGNEYDVARGSAGATGASGRDFANQARGLDGLVRLYATYAANLFAAGAAFRALSNAADTSNMVQGMNQLGAVSGQALGTIAKKLVDATDGAISFRDAMEATTKGTAAGLSSKQMMQLGEVAKKASQALGINMPDAISRLSRGISKLEPELLDELGLFTKIDKATQDYARSVGKTAASLTDFEKRQAFATAVLKEGLDKFSAIDISANPYDKLLASLQNLGTEALQVVNKVLTPLVSILSQSPSALLAVITAIGASIIKSAIPALGHYRENLKNAANESRMVFTKIYSDQQEKIGLLADTAGAAAAEAYKKGAPTLAKIAELEKSAQGFSKGRKDFAALAGKDPFAITPEEIKSLENRAKYLKGRNDAEAQALTLHLQKMKAIRAGAAAAFETASTGVIAGTEPGYTTPGSNDIINKRTLNKLASDSIRSTVAETQAIYGSRAAYAKLNEEIAKAREGTFKTTTRLDENGKAVIETTGKMGPLQAGYTRVAGIIGIVGQKLGSLINAFGIWGVAIGIAVEAISLFDSWMSKTGKQSEAFAKSLDDSKDASDNVKRTLESLDKVPFASATIQGIYALSNAMVEVNDTTQAAINSATKLKSALLKSPYDTWKNDIAKFFGGGIDKNLAKTLTTSVQDSLKLFAEAGRTDEAKKILSEALGVSSFDTDELTKAFEKGGPVIDKYGVAQKKLAAILGNSSSNLQSFKTATEASNKAYQEFIQSTASTNPLFKLGQSLSDVSMAMGKVLTGSINELNAAFNDLVDHPEKFQLFGKDFVKSFVEMRGEFKSTFEAQATYKHALNKLDEDDLAIKEKLRVTDALIAQGMGTNFNKLQKQRYEAQLESNQESRRMAGKAVGGIDTSIFDKAKTIFAQGADAAYNKANELIKTALGQAAEKASLTIAQARAGGLTGAEAAREAGRIKQEELNIQLRAIDTNIDLIKANTELRAAIEESNALAAIANAPKEADKTVLAAEYAAAKIFREMLDKDSGKAGGKRTLDFQSTQNEQVDSRLKLKLANYNMAQEAQNAARIGVTGQKTAAGIETSRAVRAGEVADLQKVKALEDGIKQQQIARLNILGGITNALTEQNLQDVISLENQIIENKNLIEITTAENALKDAMAAQNYIEFEKQRNLLNLVEKRQEAEKNTKAMQDAIKLIDLRIAKEKLLRDISFQSKDDALKITAAQLGADQEMFNIQTSLGMIYGTQAESQRKQLERNTLSNSIAQSELSLEKARADKLAEIDSRIEKAGPDRKALLQQERAAAVQSFKDQATALDITNQGRQKALDLTQSFTDRQLAYGEVFKNSFAAMGDAIIEFTKTGKLNFKGLVDSMIEGLIRYELQQQSLMMYSALRPDLMKLVGNLFGFGSTNQPILNLQGASGVSTAAVMGYSGAAKGAAYDGGLQQFAKGGMFTNSIVDSPTLFKFAKGTGLMGEAGPEAIMPLKRDSNGNLGVRAGSHAPTVDVVVNNFGSEKATTKETTDSRGNRKIEVVIGDMVAGEIGRTGSSIQQSLSGNFNTRPAVARR